MEGTAFRSEWLSRLFEIVRGDKEKSGARKRLRELNRRPSGRAHGADKKTDKQTAERVAVGAVVVGGLIIVSTIVADVLSGGASLADDPVTIGVGLSMMGIGPSEAPLPEDDGNGP